MATPAVTPRRESGVRPRHALAAAVAGFALLGLGAAGLTLRLNPHLRDSWSDLLWLHFDLALLYSGGGVVLGALGAGVVALLRRTVPVLAPSVVGGLFLAPLVYLLLLPDMGLGLPWLTDLLSASRVRQGLLLLLIGAGLGGLSIAASFLLRRITDKAWRRFLPAGVVLLLALVLGVGNLLATRPPNSLASTGAPVVLPAAPATPPPPVVLLCIDGADLDDRIEPMVQAGELPTFRRLMEEGTWGPLATFEPTLSPVVWTTLTTGRPPAEHGIHQFLYFRLPGMERPVYHFPLHLGLNFRIFPLLEKLPGLSGLRTPYTSNMRRVDALWDLVQRRYRVGIYRWLMSWPAERVNGFSVAGGIAWAQFDLEEAAAPSASSHPADLPRKPQPPLSSIDPQDLKDFVGADLGAARADRRLRAIRKALVNPTAEELPTLMEAFETRFTAAAFHPVDGFQHLFSRETDGPFTNAIAAAYRLTDRRLGEFLDHLSALAPEARVIVVSDHGFDFLHHHHTRAPAGIFFAAGPGFAAGRRIEGLSVYDVAPLVLHLLEMPLPEDLPGVKDGTYRHALDSTFLERVPGESIPTYGSRSATAAEPLDNPKDEEIKDVLRSLGYVQ